MMATGTTYTGMMEKICFLLSRYRFNFTNEDELQAGIAQILDACMPLRAMREVVIDRIGRLDFLVDGEIAIETKIGGSANELMRQVARYAQSDRIQAILVVTSRATHTLPESFNGKPVMVHSLLDGAF